MGSAVTGLPVDVAFWVFSAAAVWFGWRVFRTDSMVRASFALLASLLNVGGIMVLLAGEYLGVALFFMMAVEMTVMAIFMVAFMMNPAGLNPMQMVHQHGIAMGAGVVSFVVLAFVAFAAAFPDAPVTAPDDTIRALGHELMGGSMMLMQSVGITILATMVGGAVLASKWGRFGASDEGSLPPPLDPDNPEADAPPAPRRDPHAGHHMGHDMEAHDMGGGHRGDMGGHGGHGGHG